MEANATSDSVVALSWSAGNSVSPIDYFLIRYRNVDDPSDSEGAVAWSYETNDVIEQLTPGATYAFNVAAVNAYGTSYDSDTVYVTLDSTSPTTPEPGKRVRIKARLYSI